MDGESYWYVMKSIGMLSHYNVAVAAILDSWHWVRGVAIPMWHMGHLPYVNNYWMVFSEVQKTWISILWRCTLDILFCVWEWLNPWRTLSSKISSLIDIVTVYKYKWINNWVSFLSFAWHIYHNLGLCIRLESIAALQLEVSDIITDLLCSAEEKGGGEA